MLGANDGIISISSLAIGVATAQSDRQPILLATVAALVAGALSMAAGEYVSVSSQSDIENADIERERQELKEMPENELKILGEIFERRGLKKETALQELLKASRAENHPEATLFAEQLMDHARMEEVVSYPTAILIGEYLKLKLK